jgi:anaerobic glycerol-3-phosphate dehydrogenase
MRTTVELPPELLRAAKAEAAARGETLKDFLTRAVAHELGTTSVPVRRARVKLPLVQSSRPGSANLSNMDIEAIFAAEDAEKHAGH